MSAYIAVSTQILLWIWTLVTIPQVIPGNCHPGASSQPAAKWHCFTAILRNAAVLWVWLKVDCSTPQLCAAFQLVVDSSRTILFLAISVVSLFLWRTCEALAVYRPDFAKSSDVPVVFCLPVDLNHLFSFICSEFPFWEKIKKQEMPLPFPLSGSQSCVCCSHEDGLYPRSQCSSF